MPEFKSVLRNDRNSNLELLRILTMVCIVLDHVPCSEKALPLNKAVSDFFVLGGKFGVNIFVVMGGVLLVGKPFYIRRVLRVFCETFFYAMIGFTYHLIFYHRITFSQLGLSIKYWFPFAYIIMLLAIPIINKIDIKHCSIIAIIILAICSLLTIYLIFNPNGPVSKLTDNGFIIGPIWFCYVYVVARTIKENERLSNWRLWLLVFILMYVCMCQTILVLDKRNGVTNMLSQLGGVI